jgi:hypothetical protein
LGNSGFFFLQTVSSQGWQSYEIRDVIYRAIPLPNTKSLWVRLLAETGLIGFTIFVVWMITMWFSTRISNHSKAPTIKIIAMAGQMALIAMLAEGFSIDSFAMPYLWAITGLIAASAMLARRELGEPNPER